MQKKSQGRDLDLSLRVLGLVTGAEERGGILVTEEEVTTCSLFLFFTSLFLNWLFTLLGRLIAAGEKSPDLNRQSIDDD